MATEKVYKNLDGRRNELQNWSSEKLVTDPTGAGLYIGRKWLDTTNNQYKYYDGTNVRVVATLEDLSSIGKFQGVHDSSTGAVPSTTLDGSPISSGDFWRVSVAGTIPGIGGDDTLEVGDLIYATDDTASLAAQFTAVQANINLPSGIATAEEVTLASLPANTPTVIPTTFTNVYSIEAYDSSDELISLGISGLSTSPMAESSEALSNVVFRIVGN